MPALAPSVLTSALLTATPSVGIQYTPLATWFTGDLSQQLELGHSVQIKTLYVDGDAWPLRAYLAIDTIWSGTTHEGERFPYPADSALDVLGFLFIPHLCWLPTESAAVCAGLGQGTVNVNADRDGRDWGTWNYQLQIDVALTDHLSAVAVGKVVGRVEQLVDGRHSQFTLFMLGGGLSAQW